MAVELGAHVDRRLPDRRVEGERGGDRLGCGGLAADDLDEGDEVRWVEGVADEDPLRVGTDRVAARSGGSPTSSRRSATSVAWPRRCRASSCDLVAEPFGAVLLDEVGRRDGVVEVAAKHSRSGERARGDPEPMLLRPCPCDRRARSSPPRRAPGRRRRRRARGRGKRRHQLVPIAPVPTTATRRMTRSFVRSSSPRRRSRCTGRARSDRRARRGWRRTPGRGPAGCA